MKKIYLETQLKICYLCFKRNISKRFKTQIKKNYLENPNKNFLSDPEKIFYLGLSTVRKVASGPELQRNGRFYVRPKSGFWPKNGSYPKKSPKMTFPPLIIWAKALFFFEQLFPVVARTWLESKSGCLFLGPKFWFLS